MNIILHLLPVLALALLTFAILALWAAGFRRNKQPPLLRFAFWFNAALGFVNAWRGRVGPSVYALANFGEGEHLDGKISFIADNAYAARFLLAKAGSDFQHSTPTVAASDEPIGICTDSPAAGDPGSVDVFGAAPGTKRGTSNVAIAADADVYTDVTGWLQPEPTVAGTYWLCGRAITASTGGGDTFEFAAIKPIKVVVIAALTSAQNATAAAVDLPSSEALANALKANYNALQADVAAIAAALATPALVKVL